MQQSESWATSEVRWKFDNFWEFRLSGVRKRFGLLLDRIRPKSADLAFLDRVTAIRLSPPVLQLFLLLPLSSSLPFLSSPASLARHAVHMSSKFNLSLDNFHLLAESRFQEIACSWWQRTYLKFMLSNPKYWDFEMSLRQNTVNFCSTDAS